MELAFRVLAAVVLIVAPSVLFLGLWHGLHALRDDELIAHIHAQSGGSLTGPRVTATDVLPTSSQTESTREVVVACRTCGTPNPEDVRFCHECLSRLSG